MKLGPYNIGAWPLPINWRDWRFGFVARKPRPYGRDYEVCFGPFALGLWWNRWPR